MSGLVTPSDSATVLNALAPLLTPNPPAIVQTSAIDIVRPVVGIALKHNGAERIGMSRDIVFSVFKEVPNSEAVAVEYLIAGSAKTGGDEVKGENDYFALSGSITIPANMNSVELAVRVRNDTKVESTESVEIAIKESASYALGISDRAIGMIEDNDFWRWRTSSEMTKSQSSEKSWKTGVVNFDELDTFNGDTWASSQGHISIFGDFDSDNNPPMNSVQATIYADLFQAAYFPWQSAPHFPANDAIKLSYTFDPITGYITREQLESPGQPVTRRNNLTAVVGYDYTIDNTQEAEHTVTVDLRAVAAVKTPITTQIQRKLMLGGETGADGDGLSAALKSGYELLIGIGVSEDGGGTIVDVKKGYTLRLIKDEREDPMP